MDKLIFLLFWFASIVATMQGVRSARDWWTEDSYTYTYTRINFDKTFGSFAAAFFTGMTAAVVALPNQLSFFSAAYAASMAFINIGTGCKQSYMPVLVGFFAVGMVVSLVLYLLPLFG